MWDLGSAIDDAINEVIDVLAEVSAEIMYSLRAKNNVLEMARAFAQRLVWEEGIAGAMETTDVIFEMGEAGYKDYLTIFGWELVSQFDIEHEIKVFWNGG